MSSVVIVKRNRNNNAAYARKMANNQLFVGRHKALYEYCLERGYISTDTQYYERVSIRHIKDKDVIGMLPLEMACFTRTYTEIPLKCHIEAGKELTIDDIRIGALSPRKYEIRMVS